VVVLFEGTTIVVLAGGGGLLLLMQPDRNGANTSRLANSFITFSSMSAVAAQFPEREENLDSIDSGATAALPSN
jgi:hypothetical protein